MRKHKGVVLLLLAVLLITQFACELVSELAIRGRSDYGTFEFFAEIYCVSSGREYVYDEDTDRWRCDKSKPAEPAPEPPLWSEPAQPDPEEVESADPDPEASETMEPAECDRTSSVWGYASEGTSASCGCIYYVDFDNPEETEDIILYYRTQAYINPDDPQQRWHVARLSPNETMRWSSENIIDGTCVRTVLDKYVAFLAVPGCDDMARKAPDAVEELAVSIEPLCK